MSIPASASPDLAPASGFVLEGRSARVVERFLAHRVATVGLLVLALIAVTAVVLPLVMPFDPNKTNLDEIFLAPSPRHLLGTDSLGRDLGLRIAHGGRISLAVGILAVAIAASLGTLVGALAGIYGGLVDAILMRFVDMMLSFPRLFLLILASVLLRDSNIPSFLVIVVLLGALSWMSVARIVRASVLSLKERQFIEAARSIGATGFNLLWSHLLPNSLAPVIVAATLGVGTAIISESTLSFLGLGIQPPTASWGNLLKDAQTDMLTAPWTAIFPGLAIFLTVVSVNFVGDALRDALDPRHSR